MSLERRAEENYQKQVGYDEYDDDNDNYNDDDDEELERIKIHSNENIVLDIETL